MVKAVFLDRDGVINEDIGWAYKPEQIIFKEGIFDFCRKVLQKGYIIVVVSNQSGVAKGFFTESDVQKLHQWMAEQFNKSGIKIARFYYCPFHKDGVVEKYAKDSPLRKPAAGMFLQAAKDLSIDLSKSIMIGDKLSDRIEHPQLKSVIIKSNYVQEGYDVESLAEIEAML